MFELVPVRRIDSSVSYLHSIDFPVGLRNRCGCVVYLHELRLEFKAQYPEVESDVVTIRHQCDGYRMEDGEFTDFVVRVVPSLVFLRYTNNCWVDVEFSRGRAGEASEVARVEGEHIIVKDCPNFAAAQAFVSFKDTEDLALAELEKSLLTRAGIRGYIARDDPQPGRDYWEKIAREIQRSIATFVIWTANTAAAADAVLRELKLSQEASIPVILLLESGVEAPADFDPRRVEYASFRRESPSAAFARATEATYRRWRGRSE